MRVWCSYATCGFIQPSGAIPGLAVCYHLLSLSEKWEEHTAVFSIDSFSVGHTAGTMWGLQIQLWLLDTHIPRVHHGQNPASCHIIIWRRPVNRSPQSSNPLHKDKHEKTHFTEAGPAVWHWCRQSWKMYESAWGVSEILTPAVHRYIQYTTISLLSGWNLLTPKCSFSGNWAQVELGVFFAKAVLYYFHWFNMFLTNTQI